MRCNWPRLFAFALALTLSAPVAAAEDVALAPASDAEYAALARLTAGALLAWADADTEAILAAEDAGLLAWLNRERSLALTLPADRLLPPFAGQPFPCVPLGTTLRILTLRQIPPKVLNDLSVAVLLQHALTLSAAQPEGTLAAWFSANEAVRGEIEADAVAAFRRLEFRFLVGTDRAYLAGPTPPLSVAVRDAGGRWQVDWRLPLAMEEWSLRVAFGLALVQSGELRDRAPADWPVESYLALLSSALPGHPSVADLLQRAEPARPDPTLSCWEPFLDPTVRLCAKDDGWAACERCEDGGYCAESTAP